MASAPRPKPAGNPNRSLSTSPSARAQIRMWEGVVRQYYNDASLRRNCTVGVGHLVHYGECEPWLIHQPVEDAIIEQFFDHDLRIVENAIKRAVTRQPLTQRQFDALVSYVYNRGPGGAAEVLEAVDKGQLATAAALIRAGDKVTEHKDGKRIEKRLPGLTKRRQQEAADLEDGR